MMLQLRYLCGIDIALSLCFVPLRQWIYMACSDRCGGNPVNDLNRAIRCAYHHRNFLHG